MNILPKKRWHVRTKDNIARVRRDEAKAAAEEKAVQGRIQLAEQEARTALLRQQAANKASAIEISSTAVIPSSAAENKHINFFNEAADGQKSWGTSKELEAEKKEEQEKYEKNIGYLTYLGQSSLENTEQPWYEKPHEKRFLSDEKQNKNEVAKKIKLSLDPLKDVQKYLELSGKKPEKEEPKPKKVNVIEAKKEEKSYKKHKSKKRKKKKKRKDGSSSSEDDSADEKAKKLQRLRAERLRREEAEKKRTEQLLDSMNPEKKKAEKESAVRDGDQGYNSQFNPHLSRKPSNNKHY